MKATLAFDIYGTLIDTHGVVSALENMVGSKARAFSQTWRDKQLEYTFRRGLMNNYQDFSTCTKQALEFTCQFYNANLSEQQIETLISCYRTLPTFDDVAPSLQTLKNAGFQLYAFSNGGAEAVNTLLVAANIRDYFIDIISVDEIQTYKPNLTVYQHFLKRAAASAENSWLISSNPFDVIGALSAGMKSAWLKRANTMLFDPWEFTPTLTIQSLSELSSNLLN